MDIASEKFQALIPDVELLSKMLKIAVTVVDKDLRRVAGAGKYMDKEIKSRSSIAFRGGIFTRVIQEQKTYVVKNPRENELCRGCEFKEKCPDKYEMSAPIMVNGKAVGAIAFIGTTNLEKDRIEKNQDLYQQVLMQFADIFALKIGRTMAADDHAVHMELLNALVNHTDSGVLVLNQEDRIAFMNEQAKNLFFHVNDLRMKVSVKKLADHDDQELYQMTIGKQSYVLSGKRYHISLEQYSDILVFESGNEQKERPLETVLKRAIAVRIAAGTEQESQICRNIYQFAQSDAPVFLTGEEGTEKLEVARAIHQAAQQKKGAFVTVNCSTRDDRALERELFGYLSKNGKSMPGKLEEAKNGTLFLEQADALSLEIQGRLAELLREREYARPGSSRSRRLEARVIISDSGRIPELLEEGKFLRELYYRLNVLSLTIPPLRERKQDIRIAGDTFLKKAAKRMTLEIRNVSDSFWTATQRYEWPGNLWELESAMEYAVSMMEQDGMITEKQLPEWILKFGESFQESATLDDIERQNIAAALKKAERTGTSKELAAKQLGISLSTLYRKMKQYGLE